MSIEEVTIGPCRLIRGDCREILPTLPKIDVLVTDPPYPDIKKCFPMGDIAILEPITARQLIFWSAVAPFPLSWTAIHIWHKPNGNSAFHYERIFERYGHQTCRVWRHAAILPNYDQYKHEAVDHPTQKPLQLLLHMVAMISQAGQTCLDLYMGSGTTGVACLALGRSFIGIEIMPHHFETACRRIEAAYAQLSLFAPVPPIVAPRQEALFATGGR